MNKRPKSGSRSYGLRDRLWVLAAASCRTAPDPVPDVQLDALACDGLGSFPLWHVRQRVADSRRALAEPDFRRRLLDDPERLDGTA